MKYLILCFQISNLNKLTLLNNIIHTYTNYKNVDDVDLFATREECDVLKPPPPFDRAPDTALNVP